MALNNRTAIKLRSIRVAIFSWIVVLVVWQGFALPEAVSWQAAEAAQRSGHAFQDWLKEFRDEARGKGISDATLDAALQGVAPVERVIELDRRQPEFTQPFWSYLDQRISDQRIQRGKRMLAEHRRLLDDIQTRYGIPPRFIVAFWGLETNYGSFMGGFRAIDALVTLAYDRRRPQFFRVQLFDALQILEADHISPEAMTGSWAGAMGHMQFMPSTFIKHAVDYSGDGRKDIWQSLPDAFASAANYLSAMGWRRDETWGREVMLPEGFDLSLAELEIMKPQGAWSALGVRLADGQPLPQGDEKGAVVLPQGHDGPAFLVYDNFRVIMRWNRSINYAVAVGHLADRVVDLPHVLNGRLAQHEPLSRDDIKRIQERLNRLGFDAGSRDGLAGPRTRTAIRNFQIKHALPPDGYASPSLLRILGTMVD